MPDVGPYNKMLPYLPEPGGFGGLGGRGGPRNDVFGTKRIPSLRGSSNIGGNLQPTLNQGKLNFSGPSRNAVVVRGERQPSKTGQNPPSQWYGDQARALVIPRSKPKVTLGQPETPVPKGLPWTRHSDAQWSKSKGGGGQSPNFVLKGDAQSPYDVVVRGQRQPTTDAKFTDLMGPVSKAISAAATVELTRRIIDSGEKTDKVEIPKSKFTEMVGITHGNMQRSKEIAKRNNQPTLLNSNLQNKRSASPGQKSKNDVLNIGVGSKTTTAYEVQLRGGDIFPLDKTIGKLAAFPVTVLGKVLKVGGGMLTEE